MMLTIPLALTILLVGCQAQFPNIGNLGIISTLKNGVNNGATAVVGITNSTREGNVLTVVTTSVKKEAGAIAQPVEGTVLMTATSQCELLKEALGINYASKNLVKEDELKKLTLEFNTPALRVIYNITQASESIPATLGFNSKLPFIIVIHGFMSNPQSESFASVVQALQMKGDCNVLGLDASPYIRFFYLRSSTLVRYIGAKLGELLAVLVQKHGLNPDSIHLIGHSLGAHISGFAGKQFKQATGLAVSRISGLDPAGPCFANIGQELKLNATDANFVFVIHTTHGSLGITEPAGIVDVYPNGGTQQPGCVTQACSHSLVWDFFAESIKNPTAFIGVKCTGWDQFRQHKCEQNKVVIGYSTPSNVEGLYFLQTESTSPFGLGEKGATYTDTEGVLKSTQRLGPGSPFG